MRFTTTVPAATVTAVAPMATIHEQRKGMTLLTIDERDAAQLARVLGSASIHAGWPRGIASEPRGFASASAHVRR